ncbi:MAG: hypothetical protein R3A52_06230 [Polyangiales bacterium]
MLRRARSATVVFALALAASSGCSRERSPSRPAMSPVLAASPALDRRAANEELVDLAADGRALVARELPAPENSDADRVIAARVLPPDAQGEVTALGDVLDARFIPSTRALLVITRDHHLERRDGTTRTAIDEHVFGPLSLDAVGRYAVYTRGEVPDLALARVDLTTNRAEAVAPTLVPAWSPAISPDGAEVVVVASIEERPRSTACVPVKRRAAGRRLPTPCSPAEAPPRPWSSATRWSSKTPRACARW